MEGNSLGPLSALRATLTSLWVCRVSLFSVAAGWFLFGYAEQTQALFHDLHSAEIGLKHWAIFYVSVFVLWMLPTQLSARVMLHAEEDRFEDGRNRWYAILMVHLPWVLALSCLLAVVAGQYTSLEHIPDNDPRSPRTALEQAAYDQVVTLIRVTWALIGLWILAWIVLPPLLKRLVAARGILDNRLLRFIAIAMFGRRAMTRGYELPPAREEDEAQRRPEQLQTAWAALTLFVLWLVTLVFVYASPLEIRPELQRAPMTPVLVGSWVPVLTFFAYAAVRFRLPILAVVLIALAVLSDRVPGLHQMRFLTQQSAGTSLESRQASLLQALDWWRAQNGCPARPDPCPVRPIIVAAEGGASRAAFFTASILAMIEDLSDPALHGGPAGPPAFSRQLFALSTVSGSSLGAAVFAALREDARDGRWPRPQREPADSALWFKSGRALGAMRTRAALPAVSSRKDIVQQILAGDFLTPAIAALSLDIWVPLHARYLNKGDRTYFLEQSWEQRFDDPSGRNRRRAGTVRSPFNRPFSTLAPDAQRWRPLLVFNGTSVTTGRRIITSTLHPLVPPEGGDGAIKYESLFRDSYDTYDLMCHVAKDATPLTGSACSCSQADSADALSVPRIKGCDVGLSTAVSNSARFPIVSSQGDIAGGDGRLIDRIVDGGYFDYSGIISAWELRLQIARFDAGLNPYVVFLTNDPGFDPQACNDGTPPDELDVLRRPAAPPTPREWELFGGLRFPLDTLINARIARSEQTTAQTVLSNRYENVRRGYAIPPAVFAKLREIDPASLSFDVVSVGARCNKKKQVRPVPMNWWLSMPTQDYLDEQVCAPHNRETIAGIVQQLRAQPTDLGLIGRDEAMRRLERACADRSADPKRAVQSR